MSTHYMLGTTHTLSHCLLLTAIPPSSILWIRRLRLREVMLLARGITGIRARSVSNAGTLRSGFGLSFLPNLTLNGS